MLGPARLRAADGMAADEPVGAERGRADADLGRADVRDRALVPAGLEHGLHLGRELRHGRRYDCELSIGDCLGERLRDPIDSPPGDRGCERLGLGVVADHFGVGRTLCGKPKRRADQARADHRQPSRGHPIRLSIRRMPNMPRYLILRTFDVAEDAMPSVGRRSKEIVEEEFPEITWEHSHVIIDDTGTVQTYCVYIAPDEEAVHQHSKRLGKHTIDNVWEIAGDVSPADFPASR